VWLESVETRGDVFDLSLLLHLTLLRSGSSDEARSERGIPLMASTSVGQRAEVLCAWKSVQPAGSAARSWPCGADPQQRLNALAQTGHRAAHVPALPRGSQADREYIWQFSEEGFGNEETMQALARAHGFCAEHAEMLRRIDVEMKSMLGISTIYVELFVDLAAELAALDVERPCQGGACTACASRDAAVQKNARYLLAALTATAGPLAEKFSSSPGMCFPHFELVWASGGTSQARQLISTCSALRWPRFSTTSESSSARRGQSSSTSPRRRSRTPGNARSS
jgi:hypothetical protein